MEAPEAALDRIISSHKDSMKELGDSVKTAMELMRETVRESTRIRAETFGPGARDR